MSSPCRTLILLAAVLMTLSCKKSHQEEETLLPDSCQLLVGDVVFRRGTALTSQAVLMADRGCRYSHIGIVADSAGIPMVVHAVPDEPDYPGDPDRVKMEPARKFFSTANASLGEVCRTADPQAGERAAKAAVAIYRRGALFDHHYDDSDTVRLYCTQLVMECYREAGIELAGPPTHSFSIAGISCKCWLPSDIYQSASLTSIYTFE